MSAAGAGGIFDRAAGTFDAVGPQLFAPAGRWLVDVLAPAVGARVLDVGCGSGAVTVPAALAVGPTGWVDAVDDAPAMVERLRDEVARRGLHHVRAYQADAHAPAGAPGSYDAVTAGLMLFLLEHPDAAVRRYAQLLAPGGRLAVTTFGAPDPRWSWLLRLHLSARQENGRPWRPAGDFSTDGLLRLFTAAGLRHVRSSSRILVLTFADADEWYEWSWSHGERAVWEALGSQRLAVARRFAYDRLREMTDQAGVLEMAVEVRGTVGERPPAAAPGRNGGSDVGDGSAAGPQCGT